MPPGERHTPLTKRLARLFRLAPSPSISYQMRQLARRSRISGVSPIMSRALSARFGRGTSGFGYERGSGYEPYFATDLESSMYNQTASAYIRSTFLQNASNPIDSLTLRARYEDGFIAYLNGIEVLRDNGPTAVGSNVSIIPLDNLFDDPQGTPLADAIESDTYQAEGQVTDLGVHTVELGTLNQNLAITPNVSFNLSSVGGGSGESGPISNDTFPRHNLQTQSARSVSQAHRRRKWKTASASTPTRQSRRGVSPRSFDRVFRSKLERRLFQANAAVQAQGNSSRSSGSTRQHSYRLIFNETLGGPGRLNFPLFDNSNSRTSTRSRLKSLRPTAFRMTRVPMGARHPQRNDPGRWRIHYF